MYRIGIDLGGTNIAVGVVDDAQRIVAAADAPTRAQDGADALLDDIAACVGRALERGGLSLTGCAGVGIGVPGTCDTAHGIVRYAHNIGWDGVAVTEELRRRLGLPAFLANDADCAALGEVIAGAAKGCNSALERFHPERAKELFQKNFEAARKRFGQLERLRDYFNGK